MKKIPLIIFLNVFIFFSLFSQEDQKIKQIDLDEFINMVCQNSRFEELLIDELTLAYQEKLKIPAGDLIVSSTAEYNLFYSKDLFHGFKGGVSLSKLFPISGTEISGGLSWDPGSGIRPSSNLTLNVEQSIIKDAFGRVTRIRKKIAGMETEIASNQIIESYEEYLAFLINLYLEWYSAYMNVKNAGKAFADSEALLNNVKSKLRYNIALPIDVNKSKLQMLSKKEQYTNLLSYYTNLLYKIKEATKCNNIDQELMPDFGAEIKDVTIDFEMSYYSFQKESRTALILQMINKNSDLELKVALDDLLPSAKLYGGYSFKGDGYFFNSNRTHNVILGISIDVPAIQPHERSTYKIRKIEKNKSKLSYINDLDDIKTELMELYNNIETEKKIIELSEQKVTLSEQIIKAELKDYSQGRASLDDLIAVYNTLDSNNLSKINHTIQLSKYYIEWYRLTDTLISRPDKLEVKNNIF